MEKKSTMPILSHVLIEAHYPPHVATLREARRERLPRVYRSIPYQLYEMVNGKLSQTAPGDPTTTSTRGVTANEK